MFHTLFHHKKKYATLLVIFFLLTLLLTMSLALQADAAITWGSQGESVRTLQQKLKDAGYYKGSVDGIFGNGTFEAIKKYQKAKGLNADGIAGSATLKALGIKESGTPSASVSSKDDTTMLARAIFAESESEPYIGKVAVGAVLLNRVGSSSFPNTLSGVVYQGSALESVSNGRFNASSHNEECIRAAKDALGGWDPTYGCLYFWNPETATSSWIWSRQIVVQYGKHVFGK